VFIKENQASAGLMRHPKLSVWKGRLHYFLQEGSAWIFKEWSDQGSNPGLATMMEKKTNILSVLNYNLFDIFLPRLTGSWYLFCCEIKFQSHI
jgi:hypothetical protein